MPHISLTHLTHKTARLALAVRIACALALLCFTAFAPHAATAAQPIPTPQGLYFPAPVETMKPEALLEQMLNIPYRVDGAIDENGRHTLFAKPETGFATPGLNCSGFVLEASRLLLHRNITLAEAKRDRLSNSGPNAALGEDWDFGWDIIMNISEHSPRRLLMPGNKTVDPATTTGVGPAGFNLALKETWNELLPRFQQGKLYLLSWHQKDHRPGYVWSHYHVGLIHKAANGAVWMYQTTGQGKGVNRRDLATAEGMASFLKAFVSKQGKNRYLTIIEVDLPK